MKCATCEGKGFIERGHGILQIGCDVCNQTGEVGEFDYLEGDDPKYLIIPEAIPGKTIAETADIGWQILQKKEYTGLLFQLQGKRTEEPGIFELWAMCKEGTLEKMEFPYTVQMPCGRTAEFENSASIMDLLPVNLMCGCGNRNHYVVRFSDLREESDDNTPSGDRPDNQSTGSGDTSKSKQPQKPKAKRKAKARSS